MDDLEQTKQILLEHGYQYLDFIGSGSTAVVLICQSTKYNQIFAIKQVLKKTLADNEISALISLIHPYIVKLYLTFSNDYYQYLVMEYCPKGTIKQLRKLDTFKFVFYAKQILEVLDYCHSKNIAHRDIKPENIFLDQQDRIKLGDFGLADEFKSQQLSNKKCGSLMFFAPEILANSEFDPFKADIWALAITFFYMAAGHYPFKPYPVDDLRQSILYGEIDFSNTGIDPKIQYLIKKMTIKDPLSRYSARQLLELPIFSQKSSRRITKTLSPSFSSGDFKFGVNLNGNKSSVQTFNEESDNSTILKDEKFENVSITKIHSFNNHRFLINNNCHDCKRFVKYD